MDSPNVVVALWIALIVLVTLFVWRTLAGMASDSDSPTLNQIGAGMLGVTG